MIDYILAELNNRFLEKSTQWLRCIAFLDPRDSFDNFDVDKWMEHAEIYVDDFSDYDRLYMPYDTASQFHCWR